MAIVSPFPAFAKAYPLGLPRPQAVEWAGLHVIWASQGCPDRQQQRQVLRGGVDGLIASWRWRVFRQRSGRRVCLRSDGGFAPPISVAYSNDLALLFVSNDWRNVGVDVEISRRSRLLRYSRISQAFASYEPKDAILVFVRAEAWAKATDHQLLRSARVFLRQSENAGPRQDGRFVSDVDIMGLLPNGALPESSVAAAAICTDSQAPTWTIHPIKRVSEDGSLLP